jgi:chemotaxis protein MotA
MGVNYSMSFIIGLVLSGFVFAVLALRGGNTAMLLDPVALMLVFGGTLGSLLIITPISSLIDKIITIKKTLGASEKPEKLLNEITIIAQTARKKGLLSLESMESEIKNLTLKKGVNLILDSVDAINIRSVLERESSYISEKEKSAQELIERLAVFAPGIGMVGTLVQIAIMLGAYKNALTIAPQIAHSLLPVVYGAVLSYVLLFPLAARIKTGAEKKRAIRELSIEGVLAIQAGEPPYLVEQRLEIYLK